MRVLSGARPLWAALMVFAVLVTTVVTAGPAQAGPGDPLYLSVTKTVSNATPAPDEPFTYTIRVTCSEASCVNAQLDDAFPSELAGYAIEDVTFTPSASIIPRNVVWTVGGATSGTAPSVATADTKLSVDFTGAITEPSGIGLQNGQTFTVQMTLRVPTDLAPGTTEITNTATTQADNSSDSADDATITVTMPERIGVDVTKSWSPATQTFQAGRASSIALAATNTSNVAVDSLVVQEPQAAAEGAAALDSSNPFTIKTFDGFTAFAMPSGATTVQVDAYVYDGGTGTWGWVDGTASATPALPATVLAADVAGLRFTYSGGSIAPNAVASVTMNATQSATDRTGADLSTATHSVTNVVVATANAAGFTSVTDTASATHRINPATVLAATSKSFTPNRIAAGASSVGRIVATNASDVGVVELRAADLNYFTDKVSFGGFTVAPTWPAGTESASVIYHMLDASPDQVVAFSNGAIPANPTGLLTAVSGFEVVYTSAAGNIASGESGVISFGVNTTEDAIGGDASLTTKNKVTTTVKASNGLTDDATASADLVLVRPAVDITLDKTTLPSAAVAPGERVVTALKTQLTTTSDYVTATKIVVEDAWTGEAGFWNAFALDSVVATQVPANTSLVVEVQRPDQSGWVQVGTFAPSATPLLAGLTHAQLATALSGEAFGAADATGIRFTFEKASGFASDTIVTPYVVSRALATLRTGGSTAPVSDATVQYPNSATAGGTGHTPHTDLTATAQDVAPATVMSADGRGPDGIAIDKTWSTLTVPAQSSAQRNTALAWSVNKSYEQVAITDPTNPGSPQDSVFEAFDLKAIAAIGANSTPFTNGWYLKYDTVESVQLYIGGSWVTVPAPAGGWINGGAFVGYTLTSAESAAATGVKIVLEANDAARTAAMTAGASFDPYAPEAGSGVAWSSNDRQFTLTWQIRDKMRVSSDWVTGSAIFNTVDAGVVNNSVQLEAMPVIGGPSVTPVTANDDILVMDPDPAVTVAKAVSPSGLIYVPMAGTDAASYPTATFTVTGKNNSVAQASYVRVMDSPLCTDADPIVDCESDGTAVGAVANPFPGGVDWLTAAGQGNPFDRFDLTKVTIASSIPSQVSLGSSVVWLLHYSAGTYSTTSHTATDVNAMDAAALSDVVGVSVTFQGADPATDGGTITSSNDLTVTLATKLRTHLRSTGVAQVVGANARVNVPNRAFAQSYDPIISDGEKTGALATATAALTGGDLNVGAVKTIAPAALTQPTRDHSVTVTLGGNQGMSPVSSLAPAEVRLTDDILTSPDFWNQFSFTGLGTLNAPAGSDQVVVSVYGPFGTAGAMAWVSTTATPIAGAYVPVTIGQYGDIQGVRLAFSRADEEFFSASVPAPAWSTSSTFTVVLRDTYRDSGSPVVLAGTVDNTVTVISDRLNGETSVERTAAAQISLSPGTYQIKVNKLANDGNHTASAGESVPWDVTFTNSGTGFLTITELRDTLPAYLLYLGDTAPVYTPDASGMLGAPSGLTQSGSDLIFTWPEGARTMAPGEAFSVRIMLEVQPGLAAGERATNEMTVKTLETLASCSNIQSGGTTTSAFAADPTTCGTTDYVTPSVGPNLFTVKGVRGSLDGATNSANPDQECVASLSATGGSYFRAPCVANSVIGGVDSWVLRAQNAGTTGLDEMVIFDALPSASDRYLISGSNRGSTYRPQMLDDLAVSAPEGTDIVTEVTLSADPCYGTWANLEQQAPCEQNSEAWSVAGPDTDWSRVTAFRITVDFSATEAGWLAPGEFVDVTFSSKNVPATTADPSGATVDVPVVDSYAWNQFGVKYLDSDAVDYRKIAPARMGVHLLAGSLEIDKVVTGAYSGLAPSSFVVDVACTVEGAPVNMGEYSSIVLNRADGFSQVIDGLPSGSICTMTEPNPGGASLTSFAGAGVTRVSGVSATVTVASDAAIVTLTNTFDRPLAFTGVTGISGMAFLALALIALGAVLAIRGRRRLS